MMIMRSAQAKARVLPEPKHPDRETMYTFGQRPTEIPSCWLVQFAPSTPCDGRMQKAHLIRAQVIRREVSRKKTVIWTPAVWRPACYRHHTMLDQARTLRIPREAIPQETERWAAEHGLLWWLDRTYGVRVMDLEAQRRCLCGHPRHEHASSEGFPSVCVHQEASEDEGFYGVCPCWEFRTEPDQFDE